MPALVLVDWGLLCIEESAGNGAAHEPDVVRILMMELNMFKFLTDTAASAVNFTCDTAEMAIGGDGPTRDDVAQLLAAGLSVAAVAAATGLAVDVIEDMADQ